MSLSVEIEDGRGGTKRTVMVTQRGQLVVAPLDYSSNYSKNITSTGTAFNFLVPLSAKQFVITSIIVSADKSVSSANGSFVEIYEASSPTSTTVNKIILNLSVERNRTISLSNLNMLLSRGVWLNAKVDSATVMVTILGYYVDEQI